MFRSSRRAVAAFASVTLLALTFALAGQQQVQAAVSGPNLNYPLRHSFSMAPGMPGHGKHEPTSCYESWDAEGYLCRIVSGVEETGDKRNFLVRAQDILSNGSHPRHGHGLATMTGTVYEGCARWRNGAWHCDYATRNQVSDHHYGSDGWVARVFWKWEKYIERQAGCAAAITGLWGGVTGKGFLALLKDCDNGPL